MKAALNPKVSVVIPVYNGKDYLAEAIESALAQTYKNLEVLVVNDGSADNGETDKIAESFGNFIRYVRKPNGGVASALNYAVREMTGDYFSWLSHDDLYSEDKVEKQVDALRKIGQKNVVIYSNYSVFTKDVADAIPIFLKGVPPKHFRYWITVENSLHGCTLLIPRSAFNEFGGFNENLRTTQDYDLWFRMAKAMSFVHIPDVLVRARSHPEQGSHKMAALALTECNALLSGFIRELSPQEIVGATGKSLPDSYADIASSMMVRGFTDAGQLASDYAKKYGTPNDNSVPKMTLPRLPYGKRTLSLIKSVLPAQSKQMVKKILPTSILKSLSKLGDTSPDLRNKFSEVYEKNTFGGRVSRSGEGSDLIQTEIIRRELPRIVKNYAIKTFLDAPCGDWYWMKETELGAFNYIGIDIVEAMIASHSAKFGNESRKFLCLDLANDSLPLADLIFSRDCLVHLKYKDIFKIIDNFKRSRAKYLLTTTFTDRTNNVDLIGKDDFWRTLNMQVAPFNFPEPLLVINEGCTEELGQYADKSLALWLLDDIRI